MFWFVYFMCVFLSECTSSNDNSYSNILSPVHTTYDERLREMITTQTMHRTQHTLPHTVPPTNRIHNTSLNTPHNLPTFTTQQTSKGSLRLENCPFFSISVRASKSVDHRL